eukprot:SAG31_NODE_1778_length_7297_cov_10.330786_7_plen_78_part_00
MGHGVAQELDLPRAVNVGKSRRWKRFWFVLKPSALLYFERPKDKEPIMRLWYVQHVVLTALMVCLVDVSSAWLTECT